MSPFPSYKTHGILNEGVPSEESDPITSKDSIRYMYETLCTDLESEVRPL